MTEAQLLAAVLDVMKLYRWRTLHIRPARTLNGWRSAVQGDGVGFPDVFAVKGGTLVALELKSEDGYLTVAQRDWMYALRPAGVATRVMRPKDLPGLAAWLKEAERRNGPERPETASEAWDTFSGPEGRTGPENVMAGPS